VLAACDVPQEEIDAEIAKFRRADMLLMNELTPRPAHGSPSHVPATPSGKTEKPASADK
jgi:CPA2 family monovalent cation:H+ antiporter-2